MASSYRPITSKVPLLAKNFALQIQNLANFSASGILDNRVNISLESTPCKKKIPRGNYYHLAVILTSNIYQRSSVEMSDHFFFILKNFNFTEVQFTYKRQPLKQPISMSFDTSH